MNITQIPAPGDHKLFFVGDVITVKLKLDTPEKGKAYIRTTLENAVTRRKEVIAYTESDVPVGGQEWHDLRMVQHDENHFSLEIALLEVGHFELKCYFLPENSREPVWPGGENTHVNVEPAEYCCANSIYCAFVRQFGRNKELPESGALTSVSAEQIAELDKAGYSVIPPSGTFRDLINELDFIVDELNCRIIHLLPINPTPTTFARMGRYGSPYAALDFTAIDPALAEFDKAATPLDQFLELAGAIHRKNAKIFIDIAINHTGWAAKIHETNPEWLVKDKKGEIVSPGAWGVVWEDLTELDHKKLELWEYLADVFLTWCKREVDGFRCDAGYMIPFEAWRYIIAKVRQQYPDTIFLLEGLGGPPEVTLDLLNRANMNWAYSELFQNYSRKEVEGYISYSSTISEKDGLMVHYAETHDNSRMAAKSETYSQMRTALSALLSKNGAFGFANGVEWFAKEKIDVHMASALNWGAEHNQVTEISRLNSILIAHPAFHNNSFIAFIDSGCPNGIVFLRNAETEDRPLLIAINLECEKEEHFKIDASKVPFGFDDVYDLISEQAFDGYQLNQNYIEMTLIPGGVVCIAPTNDDLQLVLDAEDKNIIRPDKIDIQRAQAAALRVMRWKQRSAVVTEADYAELGEKLLAGPFEFVQGMFGASEPVPLVHWRWPVDLYRDVMIPPRHIILVTASHRFTASIIDAEGIIVERHNSLKADDGSYFTILSDSVLPAEEHKRCKLRTVVYCEEHKTERSEGNLLILAQDSKKVEVRHLNRTIRKNKGTFLDTNNRGGMLHPCLEWGTLNSRYDSVLAANLSTSHPEDRHIMLRRYRMWLRYHSRSIELKTDNMEAFYLNRAGGGTWEFHVPIGNGLYVDFSVSMNMVKDKNAVVMSVIRKPSHKSRYLDDKQPVQLIIRPDVEDRNFHFETKAAMGPEKQWPGTVELVDHGFTFAPSRERKLLITTTSGKFKVASEWKYSIYQENEASRGLEANSDLFSPGYFIVSFIGGEQVSLFGQIQTPVECEKVGAEVIPDVMEMVEPAYPFYEDLLLKAINHYVVKRDDLKTVIAGYPWFLDWGRDTLICARGLIAAGLIDDVKAILLQFAKFAENGTLPNMIHGSDASNRDTSDAPLWFFTACRDLCHEEGSQEFLDTIVKDDKTLLAILEEIAEGYMNGTPNGICVDKDSMLVFSPSHFTWMDTNYPAGTPRKGYPVEIQALWYAGIHFLVEAGLDKWQKVADKVKDSFKALFILEEGWLSDCLHCDNGGVKAKDAIADDHLRSNQLFAVTLGLVDDTDTAAAVLNACSELLIPGAIRSLADRPVKHHLAITNDNGGLLNDPPNPYWGNYEGDEDTRRKPAYHNGTAWSWPFPSYCEAYYMIYGEYGKRIAKSILSSSKILFEEGCFGQIPEILDGSYPHKQRGCDAQAWGVTELYRVWKLLH